MNGKLKLFLRPPVTFSLLTRLKSKINIIKNRGHMKKPIQAMLLVLGMSSQVLAQGNHVFSGGESNTFGEINLATPGSTWSTDRTATPGYFGAIGIGSYTGGTDAYNVDGYVKHYADAGNQGFVFPVGTGTDIRTLTIGGTIPANGIYATAFILGDPSTSTDPTDGSTPNHPISSLGAGIVGVSPYGQWDWQDISNNAAGMTVTASIPDMTGFSTAANLRLVGWNGSQWVDLSQGSTASGNTENSTLQGTMINGITAIGIGTITAPLPVTLMAFTATARGCQAELNWQTAQEEGFSHFEVQASADGQRFETLGRIAGRNARQGGSYSFVADQAVALQYYRLRMVDLDGSSEQSRIRMVQTACGANSLQVVRVWPNPTQSVLTVRVPAGSARLYVLNGAGQAFMSRSLGAGSQPEEVTLEVSGLSGGQYLLHVIDGQGRAVGAPVRFSKQ